jgi:Ca2+/H+ antiporter
MNKNEKTESQMIRNIPELVEAARRELVVGKVVTAATEFLAAAPFAIHVAMQLVLNVLICAR